MILGILKCKKRLILGSIWVYVIFGCLKVQRLDKIRRRRRFWSAEANKIRRQRKFYLDMEVEKMQKFYCFQK